MTESTPTILGNLFLDGFLWGRGLFVGGRTTTRASLNITNQPINIIIKIMDILDRYADIELLTGDVGKGNRIPETMDIRFFMPVNSPGRNIRDRSLQSDWQYEFLRGVLYSRSLNMGKGNCIRLSQIRWLEIYEKICQQYEIPYNRNGDVFMLSGELSKHPFYKEWMGARTEEREEDFGLENEGYENIPISGDTRAAESHYQIRLGFKSSRSAILRSIRGVAEGRFFWFRPELLNLKDSDDLEIRLEARIALAYTCTNQDLANIQNELEDDKKGILWETLNKKPLHGFTQNTLMNKKISNRVMTLETFIEKYFDNRFTPSYSAKNETQFSYLLMAFRSWLNNEELPIDDYQYETNQYFKSFNMLIERNDDEIKFIMKRISEIEKDPNLEYYRNYFSKILMDYYIDDYDL